MRAALALAAALALGGCQHAMLGVGVGEVSSVGGAIRQSAPRTLLVPTDLVGISAFALSEHAPGRTLQTVDWMLQNSQVGTVCVRLRVQRVAATGLGGAYHVLGVESVTESTSPLPYSCR